MCHFLFSFPLYYIVHIVSLPKDIKKIQEYKLKFKLKFMVLEYTPSEGGI